MPLDCIGLPIGLPLDTTGMPLDCHWIATGDHWEAIGLVLDCHWIAIRLPLDTTGNRLGDPMGIPTRIAMGISMDPHGDPHGYPHGCPHGIPIGIPARILMRTTTRCFWRIRCALRIMHAERGGRLVWHMMCVCRGACPMPCVLCAVRAKTGVKSACYASRPV